MAIEQIEVNTSPQNSEVSPSEETQSLSGHGFARSPEAQSFGLGFILFLLATSLMFVRPEELVPALQDWPIYYVLLPACFLASAPVVLRQLTLRSLYTHPLSACVVGVLGAIVLSNLSQPYLESGWGSGFEFYKVVVYYFLLVGLVNSPVRMRQFLFWLAVCTTVLAGVSLLQFYGVLHLPALTTLQDREVSQSGETLVFSRLAGTGGFNDPNDLCLILVIGSLICLYEMGEKRWGYYRFGWLAPLALCGHALARTQSRGGFLALLAGLLVLCRARFGWGKTLVLVGIGFPLLLVVFGSRQTDLSTEKTTSQERIQIWSQGFELFGEAPLLGIGPDNFEKRANLVAHNAYLHGFVELGFLGGTLFLGAFSLALWWISRLASKDRQILDPDLRRLRPFLMAIVTAYAVGLVPLSQTYHVPPYLVVGLAAAFLQMTATIPAQPIRRFDGWLLGRIALVSVAFLAGLFLFVQVFAHVE